MPALTTQSTQTAAYSGDEARWRAVATRDPRADGSFCYSVRTTGIYCRPSCAARRPRRENVAFHPTSKAAERAGFRPCKRCRPDRPDTFGPRHGAVTRACRLIDQADGRWDVESLAAAVGMSASHFQRVFKSQTGATPKAYAAARRAQRLREVLPTSPSVTAAMYRAGFNSTGRFYSSAAQMLGMTPAAFRAGGRGATIRFAVSDCSLGWILVAASQRGICSIALGDDPKVLIGQLKARFAQAQLTSADRIFRQWVKQVVDFVERPAHGLHLPLDIQGTAFQHRVWRKLSEIPCGRTRTYGEIAADLGSPNATRAVAAACAANSIAVAIPCHRVVRSDGSPTAYRWGAKRKLKLLHAERQELETDTPHAAFDTSGASPTIRRRVVPRKAKS